MKIHFAAQPGMAADAEGEGRNGAGAAAALRDSDEQARTVSAIEQPAGWTPVRHRWLSYAACGL